MKLSRVNYHRKATFGVLVDELGLPICVTLENPWKENKPSVSCIPVGRYIVKLADSPKYGPNMWQVQNVPNRTHILFHIGNLEQDTRGCILPGKQFGWLGGESALHPCLSIELPY